MPRMLRAVPLLLRVTAAVLAVASSAVVLLSLLLNLPQGQRLAERLLTHLSGEELLLSGISGRFPDMMQVERIEIRDAQGTWLVLNRLALHWSPLRLLAGRVRIDELESARVIVERLPDYPPEPEETDWFPGIPVHLMTVRIPRLDLAEHVAGRRATLALTGSGGFDAPQRFAASVAIQRQDQDDAGRYSALIAIDPAHWRIDLDVSEPAEGLLTTWSGLTGVDPWTFRGTLNGPPNAAQTNLRLEAGRLQADAHGVIDQHRQTIDLHVEALAPELQWHSGYSWHSANLTGWVRGPYDRPQARGTLRIDRLRAPDAGSEQLTAEITSDAAGNVHAEAELSGLRIPGPKATLFGAAPIVAEADARLGLSDGPLNFSLRHPLLRATGQMNIRGDPRGRVDVHVPDLMPFTALAGIDARGNLDLQLQGSHDGGITQVAARSTVHLTADRNALIDLLGAEATLLASARIGATDVAIPQIELKGKHLQISMDGRYSPERVAFDWKLDLPNLAVLLPDLGGRLAAIGSLNGKPRSLTLAADVTGEATSKSVRGGPVDARIVLQSLPDKIAGSLTLKAMLAGSPLAATAQLVPQPTGDYHLTLDRAAWQSMTAHGFWALSAASPWPSGSFEFRIARLEDFSVFTGVPLSGTLSGNVASRSRGKERVAEIRTGATALRVGDLRSDRIAIDASVLDDGRQPLIRGRMDVRRYALGALGGNAALTLEGPFREVKMDLTATAEAAGNPPMEIESNMKLDATGSIMQLNAFRARWLDETVRLKAPVELSWRDGIKVGELRLGARNAEMRLTGRLSPALDVDARLTRLPVALAAARWPALKGAKGTVEAECRLTGPYDRLRGTATMRLAGLQFLQAAGLGFPPAELGIAAELSDGNARLDAHLAAGAVATLTARGEIPLSATGVVDLDSDGHIDLKVLDGWLTPQGQRARGVLTMRSTVRGALPAPRVNGDVRLVRAEFQDFPMGLRITDLSALAQFDGDSVQLTRLDAKMTPGRVTASGEVTLREPGYPFRLQIIARNARPLSSERLNVTLNSDLHLQGNVTGNFELRGGIDIRRAEIRIPERMPARIAVLNVRKPGAPPAQPPPPPPSIGLDLTLDAPAEIFVRGRGLDAELGGRVHLEGSMADPQPTGAFRMRRGEFKLAGRTLNFGKGEVGFDGGTLTDPSLDFVATTASPNVTATLAVGGTASKPKILLSSVPELPQDEILAQLLFGRNAASLGALELAEIASALASLTGVSGSLASPLEMLRKGLGLDRLSMGTDKAGPTLEAGRYIAPGVYLGAKQGFTGATPSAAVQVDVTEGLKLEGTVGTGSPTASQSGTTSVGIIYQFEY